MKTRHIGMKMKMKIGVGDVVRVIEGPRKSKHVGKVGNVVSVRKVAPNGTPYELFKIQGDDGSIFELTAKSLVNLDIPTATIEVPEAPKVYQVQIPDRVPPYISPLIEYKVAKVIAERLIEEGIKFQLLQVVTF